MIDKGLALGTPSTFLGHRKLPGDQGIRGQRSSACRMNHVVGRVGRTLAIRISTGQDREAFDINVPLAQSSITE
jgi:hypothetical protein